VVLWEDNFDKGPPRVRKSTCTILPTADCECDQELERHLKSFADKNSRPTGRPRAVSHAGASDAAHTQHHPKRPAKGGQPCPQFDLA